MHTVNKILLKICVEFSLLVELILISGLFYKMRKSNLLIVISHILVGYRSYLCCIWCKQIY